MKVILDINDEKADFFMEVLKNFSFVQADPLTPYKEEILIGMKDAVDEMNKIKSGQKKSQSLNEFLDGI